MYFKTSLNVFQELIRYLAQSGSNASGLVKALSVLSVQAQVSTYCVLSKKWGKLAFLRWSPSKNIVFYVSGAPCGAIGRPGTLKKY